MCKRKKTEPQKTLAKPWYEEVFPDADIKYVLRARNDNPSNDPNVISSGNHPALLVYIDHKNNIRWKEHGHSLAWDGDREPRIEALSNLNIAQTLPMEILDENEIFNYKRILGTAFVAALQNRFSIVDDIIIRAQEYAEGRLREKTKFYTMWYALICLVVIIGISLLIACCGDCCKLIMLCSSFGAIGAFFSLWRRSKNIIISYGNKKMLFLETASRLIIGMLCAVVLVGCIGAKLIFTDMTSCYHVIVFGFAAGLVENWIPSIAESITTKSSFETSLSGNSSDYNNDKVEKMK